MNVKNMKFKINNQKGVTSINFVILMIIASIFIMGGISFISKTMIINEIQGKMDKAGIIALRMSVDETKFRQEELYVEKSQARNEFQKLMSEQLTVGDNYILKSYKIEEINVYSHKDAGIGKLGIPGDADQQYFLESTITATFQSDPIIDGVIVTSISFFDFLTTKSDRTSMTLGTAGDGEMEVIVRSVTRIVMR